MKQAITVVALVLVALFSGCNSAEESAEAEAQELQRKIEALKKEKQEAASLRDAGLDAELAAAREQLQIALAALEKEGRGNTEGEDGPKAGEELLIDDAPRAVVVEEGDEIKLGLKLNGPLAPEPVALLDAKDHQIFFAELGKFGEWFETDSYGFVWQPAELKSNPAWRPYTRGRWVNSDQGWTWLSDEPFGWAVYHYGRWVLLVDHGWVWVPGDDWAPAWVAWRQNDSYLGWAPLPPETLYDDFYDYDSGIDLAYDIAPDYYNFVPVDYFFEPLLPYCVPRATVVTIIINTRNVTRFSMRDHRVHCGGPDLAWVNRHTGRNVRPCRVDFGGGADRFAHRGHHRLNNGRLEVFAPQVDAPWNAAVCPSRVSGYLGKVEVVRGGKGSMDRALVQRHQRAAVQRHQAARDAMTTEVCQVALRQNIEHQRAAQDRGPRRDSGGEGQRRRVAEENLRAAAEAVAAAERRLVEPNLNPKQESYARRAAAHAREELVAARAAHTASLPEDRGGEVVRNEGRRDLSPRGPRAGAAGDESRGERSGRGPQRAVAESEQSDATASVERGKEEAAELAAQQERERAAQAERTRIATERRQEEEKLARKREEILTAARTEEEAAKRRANAESLSAKQRATAQRAARDAERRRKEAEEAVAEELRQQAIAVQKRDAEEEKKREAAERAQLAEKQRRVAEEQARVAERAKREASTRAAEQHRRAQEARAARVEADKTEERRQMAERAQSQSKAEAIRRAQDAQKAAAEEQSRVAAAERRRQAQAQKEAEESQRRAAMEAQRRAAAERAQVDAQRRAAAERAQVDAQRRAAAERAQVDAQRRAAAERAQVDAQRRAQADVQRRAQADAQRRAAAESARRQQESQQRAAASQARAEAARRQQEAARKQQAEQSRKQSQQQRGRKR